MDTVGKGVVAGFIAMLASSLLLDPLFLLIGSGSTPAPGLQLHFFVGPVMWGAIFAFFHDHMRGPSWLRGVLFASGAWIVVTVGLLATIGTGRFGIGIGPFANAMSLLVHVVYGALLGAIYGRLASPPLHDDLLRPAAR